MSKANYVIITTLLSLALVVAWRWDYRIPAGYDWSESSKYLDEKSSQDSASLQVALDAPKRHRLVGEDYEARTDRARNTWSKQRVAAVLRPFRAMLERDSRLDYFQKDKTIRDKCMLLIQDAIERSVDALNASAPGSSSQRTGRRNVASYEEWWAAIEAGSCIAVDGNRWNSDYREFSAASKLISVMFLKSLTTSNGKKVNVFAFQPKSMQQRSRDAIMRSAR